MTDYRLPDDHITLGNIVVHRGEPPLCNPYRGTGRVEDEPVTIATGRERAEALGLFLMKGEAGEYRFFFAPPYGGSRRLNTPPKVNPDTLRYYWNPDGTPKTEGDR